MTHLKKRILLIVMSAIFMVSMGMMTATANNYHDTKYYLDYKYGDVDGNGYCTDLREKTDTSHVYMKCTYTSFPYVGYAVGNVDSYNYPNALIDCSRGKHYTFTCGTVWWMLNWIYEDGYRWAGVSVQYPQQGISYGLWSPDSI